MYLVPSTGRAPACDSRRLPYTSPKCLRGATLGDAIEPPAVQTLTLPLTLPQATEGTIAHGTDRESNDGARNCSPARPCGMCPACPPSGATLPVAVVHVCAAEGVGGGGLPAGPFFWVQRVTACTFWAWCTGPNFGMPPGAVPMPARYPGEAGDTQADATEVLFPSGGAKAAKCPSTGAAVTVQPWAAVFATDMRHCSPQRVFPCFSSTFRHILSRGRDRSNGTSCKRRFPSFANTFLFTCTGAPWGETQERTPKL